MPYIFFHHHKPISLFGLLKLLNWIFLRQTSQLRSMRFACAMLPSTEDDSTTDSSAELTTNVRHTSLDRQRHHLQPDKQDKHQCCSEYKTQPVSSNSAQFTSEPNQILATFGKVVSFNLTIWLTTGYCFKVQLWSCDCEELETEPEVWTREP